MTCLRHYQGEFTEAHELDRKWRVPQEMIERRLSQEEAKEVVGEVGMRTVDYEECIGAKKHLVTSPHIPSASPLRGSTSYVAAEYVHW